MDNYLEVEYDLSKVLFIATANTLDTIQPALRDRMEIIEITGYTAEEKVEIAMRHLVPKQLAEHGLKPSDLKFSRKIIRYIIDKYTRESGVRNLERKIASIIRFVARAVAMNEPYQKEVNAELVRKALGIEVFEEELYQGNEIAGVVTGLAWTQAGGEILL